MNDTHLVHHRQLCLLLLPVFVVLRSVAVSSGNKTDTLTVRRRVMSDVYTVHVRLVTPINSVLLTVYDTVKNNDSNTTH